MSITQLMSLTGVLAGGDEYTFEMWGAGGAGGAGTVSSGGGSNSGSPGGGGSYVGGTFQGLTKGTVLELLSGAVGVGGLYGGNGADGGAGGGSSAIRIQGGDIVASAGGGGGGGSGGYSAADSTAGRGGNSVDGSAVYATSTPYATGGGSGTSSASGSHPSFTAANPPTKTDDLQDGGVGMQGNNLSGGAGPTNNLNPSGWGGSGGRAGSVNNGDGGGGGGGGGYFGGSGGGGNTGFNRAGAGGGGGGSYVNGTYVETYSSDEGAFESAVTVNAAVDQTAGSSASAFDVSVGRGGAGGTTGNGVAGEPGGVFIYKNGTLVASVTTSGGTTTYTI